MAVGNSTNVYGTVRYLDGRYGSPNGFDLYRIADDSVSPIANQLYVSVAADSQISPTLADDGPIRIDQSGVALHEPVAHG